MRDAPADALMAVLEEERAAIRSGTLADLPALAARKTALAQDVAMLRLPADVARRIDRALRRNARLLIATCDGIKAAQSRLTALEEVRSGLSLYTAAGDRTTVARRTGTLERKA